VDFLGILPGAYREGAVLGCQFSVLGTRVVSFRRRKAVLKAAELGSAGQPGAAVPTWVFRKRGATNGHPTRPLPQGLKPAFLTVRSARLKPCPSQQRIYGTSSGVAELRSRWTGESPVTTRSWEHASVFNITRRELTFHL